jgi:hypothetical protein
MISNVNDDSFSGKKFLDFNIVDLDFIKNKKLKQCAKFLVLFLLILFIIIISVISFKFYKISSLNNEILSLKNELLKVKKESKNIEKEYFDIIEEKKKISTEIDKKKKEIKEIINESNLISEIFYPYNSDIIETFHELNYIRNLFNGSKIEMVYKSSITKEDKKVLYNNTKINSYLLLILTTKGAKIGAYTSLNFKPTGNEFIETTKFDDKAFLFSLNRKKKFNVLKNKFALYCDNDDFIQFGSMDLQIPYNFLSQNSICKFPINFEGNENDNKILTQGEQHFLIKELEIFHICDL